MSDYADEIAARIIPDAAINAQRGERDRKQLLDTRVMLAAAAREGYALGYGAKS